MAEEKPENKDGGENTVERLSISVTWERSPARNPGRASPSGAADAGSRNSSEARNSAESDPVREAPEGGSESSSGAPHPDWSQDWSHGRRAAGSAGEEDLSDEEVEADLVLLDDAFLKRTFKEVHFPASKELCLRFVDQEQDFAYGLDRTVNLHHVITHLEPEEFPTRRDLLKAIKERIHHHALPRTGP